MIHTILKSSPYAQLTYLIPREQFSISSESDVTKLHILEHWVLEGAGKYQSSDEIFRAARELGGSVSATVSRRSFELKLEFLASNYVAALELMQSLIHEPHFSASNFQAQLTDVADELSADDDITRLFDYFYAKLLEPPYSFSGGGAPDGIKNLTVDDMTATIQAYKQSHGILILADANETQYEDSKNSDLANQFQPARLKMQYSRDLHHTIRNTGLLMLDWNEPLDLVLVLAQFLQAGFGRQVTVHSHVLPNMTLSAVSYDHPNLTVAQIYSEIDRFKTLPHKQLTSYRQLAAAEIQDRYSYASGAAKLTADRWANKEYDRAIAACSQFVRI